MYVCMYGKKQTISKKHNYSDIKLICINMYVCICMYKYLGLKDSSHMQERAIKKYTYIYRFKVTN